MLLHGKGTFYIHWYLFPEKRSLVISQFWIFEVHFLGTTVLACGVKLFTNLSKFNVMWQQVPPVQLCLLRQFSQKVAKLLLQVWAWWICVMVLTWPLMLLLLTWRAEQSWLAPRRRLHRWRVNGDSDQLISSCGQTHQSINRLTPNAKYLGYGILN